MASIGEYLYRAVGALASNIGNYFNNYISIKIVTLKVTNTVVGYDVSGMVDDAPMYYDHIATINGDSPESYCWGDNYKVYAGTHTAGGTTMAFTLLLVKRNSTLSSAIHSTDSDVQLSLTLAKTNIDKINIE